VIVLLAAITLINFIAAVQGFQSGMKQAEDSFDRHLVNLAHIIASVASFESHDIAAFTADAFVYQIWSASEELLERSDATTESPITHFEAGFNHANFSNYRWRTYSLNEQHNGRWIMVAQRMDDRYAMADSIIAEAILPIAIGIPVAGLLIWFIVSSGLAPLYRFDRQLQQKHVEDLSPVQLDNPPQELAQVLQSTNQLLQRVSDSVNREKRFASDAAHELRTPISILKIHLHNLQHDYPEAIKQTEEFQLGIARLEHLVEQILALYRCAPDQYIARFEPVDLFGVAQEVVARQYQTLELRDQSIELRGDSTMVQAIPFAIDTLVQNLLSNASKYSPQGSEIRITTGLENKHPFIRVEDSGPGIAEQARAQVFDRFYRVPDDTTQQTVTGSGLGLAIVKNIVQQHRAQITLGDSSFSAGLAVTVTFTGADEL
jgi:two-component system sensor histidine kinase QseC